MNRLDIGTKVKYDSDHIGTIEDNDFLGIAYLVKFEQWTTIIGHNSTLIKEVKPDE